MHSVDHIEICSFRKKQNDLLITIKYFKMKCITVYAYEIALVMKRGKLVDVLTEGTHLIGFGKRSYTYDLTKPFLLVNTELVLMAESPLLEPYLDIVSIKDGEIGVEMIDGKFSRVMTASKVAYWKEPMNYSVDIIDLKNPEVAEDVSSYLLMQTSLLGYVRVFPVESYQKGLLYIDGKFVKYLDPGVYRYWKSDKIATVKTIDTRVQYVDISGQEILTSDKAGIRINFSAQYQVTDVEKALIDTKDYQNQLYTIIQLALREYVGTMTLDQLLSNKEAVGPYILEACKSAMENIGVVLLSGGIKDIVLPGDVKAIMNQVLIAEKKAQANIIMRREETASTRSLLNTAKLMEHNTMLMKLKEMEYMEKIADKVGEISVNGKGRVIDQLNDLLVTTKT